MCDVRTVVNYYHTSKCLVCGHQDRVNYPSKEEYQEVTVCPKCNGAFVDAWKLGKYKQSKETVEPLLQIVLSDINAVPVVLYKGEEIKQRIRISFDWKTNANYKSGSYIRIEHGEVDEKSINTKIIQHNHPIVEEQVELYRL
ncbi:hypothetical protein ACQKFU_26470 [Bacillus mycoides]|uniref:hypothetical protein n=1 Tax=Bacillus mycoides TaxID=1405 RepID=UPI003D03DE8D